MSFCNVLIPDVENNDGQVQKKILRIQKLGGFF